MEFYCRRMEKLRSRGSLQEFVRWRGGLATKGGTNGMRSAGTVNQIFEWHRRVSVSRCRRSRGSSGTPEERKGTVRGGDWVLGIRGSGYRVEISRSQNKCRNRPRWHAPAIIYTLRLRAPDFDSCWLPAWKLTGVPVNRTIDYSRASSRIASDYVSIPRGRTVWNPVRVNQGHRVFLVAFEVLLLF